MGLPATGMFPDHRQSASPAPSGGDRHNTVGLISVTNGSWAALRQSHYQQRGKDHGMWNGTVRRNLNQVSLTNVGGGESIGE